MSDVVVLSAAAPTSPAPAAAPAKPVKAPKAPKAPKVAKAKTPSAHPPYLVMIKDAIKKVKDRKGASKQAILKYISTNYQLGSNAIQINSHLRLALKRGVTSKALVQAAGSGAKGRFRVPEKATASTAAEKKPAAKAAAKKAVKPKKAAEKKAKSPKKIAKPAAKKVAKSPKKAAPAKKAAAAKPKKAVAKATA